MYGDITQFQFILFHTPPMYHPRGHSNPRYHRPAYRRTGNNGGRKTRYRGSSQRLPSLRQSGKSFRMALAHNLGNFTRTLAMRKAAEPWSLSSLREKLIKIGANVVSHGRYITFQMAEVSRQIFADILSLIAGGGHRPPRHEGARASKCFTRREEGYASVAGKASPFQRSGAANAPSTAFSRHHARFVSCLSRSKARSWPQICRDLGDPGNVS